MINRHVALGALAAVAVVGGLYDAAITAIGFVSRYTTAHDVISLLWNFFLIVAVAGLVWLASWRPGWALTGLTLLMLSMVLTFTLPEPEMVVALAVAFACAAWGSRFSLALSGLLFPAMAALFAFWVGGAGIERMLVGAGLLGNDFLYSMRLSRPYVVLFGLLELVLCIPWLAGVVVRFRNRTRAAEVTAASAEAARDEATDVARLREAQAQLARDVHDVVGHSLTVILAQAQAGAYLEGDQLKASLATIATTAQSSLEDVRQVLAATSDHTVAATAPQESELHAMLDGVRASGREVRFSDEGQPRPLPPELATTVHRVLQEMVTNAVRHGAPGEPIVVERHWGWDLRLEVINGIGALPRAAASGVAGRGVDGMRRRVEGVGGRLDVRLRTDPPTHTVTAWVPLPTSAHAHRTREDAPHE